MLFSAGAAPVRSPPVSAQGFGFLHIPVDASFLLTWIVAILSTVRCISLVVLICIPLMISDVFFGEMFFMFSVHF